MRVLHIIDSFNMGGAETWLLDIVRNTHKAGSDFPRFDFLLAGGKEAIFDKEIASYGCKLHYLLLDKNHVLSFVRGFRKILRDHSYDAIHDHQDLLAGWHFLFGVGLLPRVRVVHFHNPFFQVRNNYGVTAGRRMKLSTGKKLMRKYATHLFGTSGQLLDEYGVTPNTFPAQNVRPFHCAFNIQQFAGDHGSHHQILCETMGLDPSRPIVLFAGRFDVSMDIGHPQNHKNSRFAVEVIRKFPEAYLLMAGKNEHIKETFESFLKEHELSDRVFLLGVRKDMAHLMLASDVLLFPSRAEGLGMVAVEAQSAGLPVLASQPVPKEISVLEEYVAFMDLNQPFEQWASKLRELSRKRNTGGTSQDVRWSETGFNLDVCCSRLRAVYEGRS